MSGPAVGIVKSGKLKVASGKFRVAAHGIIKMPEQSPALACDACLLFLTKRFLYHKASYIRKIFVA